MLFQPRHRRLDPARHEPRVRRDALAKRSRNWAASERLLGYNTGVSRRDERGAELVPGDPRSMTRMSHPTAPVGNSKPFWRLAWLSLLLLPALCSVSGCIVADPPSHERAGTPPMLDLNLALPLVTQITTVRSPDDLDFSVAVRSEDRGDGLAGLLFRDYQFEDDAYLGADFRTLPSTFDDLRRRVTVTWRRIPESLKGCHQVTLIVTHKSNVASNNDGELTPVSRDDTALVAWWINVNPDEAHPEDLLNCPSAEAPP